MNNLTGSQKKYLRGLAHSKKPVVHIGRRDLTPQVIDEIRLALDDHELIKVKCIDRKEKADKKEIAKAVSQEAECELVGIIGHILILFKQQKDPKKQKISLPRPASGGSAVPEHPTHSDSAE